MSLAKSILGFIVSVFFVISLYLTITSYTMGNLIQKENIKDFIQNQTMGGIISENCEDLCSKKQDECKEYCGNLEVELRQTCENECLQLCIQQCVSQSNESQQYVDEAIEDTFNTKIGGISLDRMTKIFRNNILFLALSLIFGFSIFLVSDNPIIKLGNNILAVSISLLSMGAIPVLIITNVPFIKLVSDYMLDGFYQQIIIGIILLAIGIILKVIGKKVKLKKEVSKKVKKKK